MTVLLLPLLLALVLALQGCAGTTGTYRMDSEERQALVCRPAGPGPFPAVVFNHGSVVDAFGWPGASQRGYRLGEICQALADDGFLAFVPIREVAGRGAHFMRYEERYKEIVSHAVDHVRTREDVDASRVALMGFSMGGLITLKVAVERSDLRALVLLAPAWGQGELAETALAVGSIGAPVLLMIEAGDSPQILRGAAVVEEALRAQRKAIRAIRYDRGGGHRLFYGVDYYWPDLGAFLRETLR